MHKGRDGGSQTVFLSYYIQHTKDAKWCTQQIQRDEHTKLLEDKDGTCCQSDAHITMAADRTTAKKILKKWRPYLKEEIRACGGQEKKSWHLAYKITKIYNCSALCNRKSERESGRAPMQPAMSLHCWLRTKVGISLCQSLHAGKMGGKTRK
ncbi:hypothetical protein L7F22_041541 [Adiantum nelumboides]|nr:hypothetical protein [Adiantum nelumboides]